MTEKIILYYSLTILFFSNLWLYARLKARDLDLEEADRVRRSTMLRHNAEIVAACMGRRFPSWKTKWDLARLRNWQTKRRKSPWTRAVRLLRRYERLIELDKKGWWNR